MTIRQPMNELTVKRLKYDPKQGRFEYLDPPMHGHGTFGVRVNKTSKSFILLYSFHNHPRRLTLGKYPAMSLTEAREQAAQAINLLAQGIDPGQKKVAELFEYRESPTFAEAAEIYLDHVKLKNSERTLHEYKRLLEVDFIPHLGRMKMVDIKRKQVIALLDEKAKTAGIQANRNLAVIRAMFNFCVDRDILDATPLVQMKKLVKDVPRERTLNRHELVWFLRELTAPYLNENTRFALLLSLMLAQRSGRIVEMRWVDLDFYDAMWDRSGKFEKNNNPIAIPLSDEVMGILKYLKNKQRKQIEDHKKKGNEFASRMGQYVFPGRFPGQAQTQPSLNRAMHRMYTAYVKDMDRVEHEGLLRVADGYPRPVVHDLRRTATTHMTSRGLGKDVRSRILNHKDMSVDAVYDRYAYFDEKAEALSQWHAFLRGLLEREFDGKSWIEVYGDKLNELEPSQHDDSMTP
ncbi:site-specific integrase [Halopseudomonas aestusnigri]|nr:site-specific integrase [Halopseudomonas aestusnigri]